MKQLYCPGCRAAVSWEGNRWRPFCSERCKINDLGAWSNEDYRVPEAPETEDGEAWSEPDTESQSKDFERNLV